MPSTVAWTDSGELLVGAAAAQQLVTNPDGSVTSAIRLLGRRMEDVTRDESSVLPEVLKRHASGDAAVDVHGVLVTFQEVVAQLLISLKKSAEAHLGDAVEGAVITVPSYCRSAARHAIVDAAAIAGLRAYRLVSGPTAAALALATRARDEKTIGVYDFGAGGFGFSIVTIEDGIAQTQAAAGDPTVSGDAIDALLVQRLLTEHEATHGDDVSQDRMVLHRLLHAVQGARAQLCSNLKAAIQLPFLTANAKGPTHLSTSFTRAWLDSLAAPLIDRSLAVCRAVLADAGRNPGDLDEIVMLGDCTRMPSVDQAVRQLFPGSVGRPNDADELSVLGASVLAGILSGDLKDIVLLDVTPHSLSVETLGGVSTCLIPRNTTIPTRRQEVFSTAQDQQTKIEIHVVEGENAKAAENATLGRFHLEGILPAPRGVPKIDVSFSIDGSGVISIEARDQGSKKEQRVTVTAQGGLGAKELEHLKAKYGSLVAAPAGDTVNRRRAPAAEPPPTAPKPRAAINRAPQPPSPATHPAQSAQWDAFLSHASEDIEVARRICAALKAFGWRVFFAPEHLNFTIGSAQWSAAIDNALDASKTVVLVATPLSLGSRWVTYEWRSFHDDILGGTDHTIIPICTGDLGPRELPRALRRYQMIDLRDHGPFDDRMRQVNELLRGHVGRTQG